MATTTFTTAATTIRCPRCWKHVPASAAYCRRCGTELKSAAAAAAARLAPAGVAPAAAPPPYRRCGRRGNPRPALVAVALAASLAGVSTLRLASPPAPVARPHRLVRPPALHPRPPQQFGAPGTDVNWPLPAPPPPLPAPPTYPIPTWAAPAPPPPPPPGGRVAFPRATPNPYRYPGAPAAAPRGYGRMDPHGRRSHASAPGDRRLNADAQSRDEDDGRW